MKSPESDIRVIVVGIGSAGLHLLDKLAAVGLPAGNFIVMDSDCQSLHRCQIAERIQLGKTSRRGWGCSGDTAEGASCVRATRDRVAAKLKSADMVIVVAGMGGGMGGGGAPVVAEIASEGGALVLSIAIEPFDLEGRGEVSDLALQRLIQVSDTVIRIPNQSMMEQMTEGCSVQECLEISNGRILEAMIGLGRLVRSDGLLNIDFTHVNKLLRGQHGESHLATIEMAGDVRPRAVMDELMKHPFFKTGNGFSQASGMIVSLVGDDSLNMDGVSEFVEYLESMAPETPRVFGVHVDKSMNSRMGAMLLVPSSFAQKIDLGQKSSINRTNRTVETTNKGLIREMEEFQQQLPLVSVSKGRFDKSEPNLHDGEDLDVPTFLRRNMIFN